MTHTIQSNFEAWLSYRKIDGGLLQFCTGDADQFADRVWFHDPGATVLQSLLEDNASHDDNNPMHGRSCVLSVRERSSPSLQLCVHRGLDAKTGKKYLVYEVDFDKAPPTTNPKFVLVHFGEVSVNTLTHGLTDQVAIATGLIRRGIIQERSGVGIAQG